MPIWKNCKRLSMRTDKEIKIAVVFHDTIFNSGGTRSMLDLVDQWLTVPGLRILCVFPRNEGTAIDYLKDKNVEICSFRYWYCTGPVNAGFTEKAKLRLKLILSWFLTQKQIRSDLKNRGIDLVYSNTGVILTGAWISKALGVPHIWHIREFMEEDHGITTLFSKEKYYRFVNTHADKVVLISQTLKKKYVRGIQQDKILVVHDDLSPRYLVKPEVPWAERKMNILFAGTVCAGKGQLVAVQALGLLKKKGILFELQIAGTVKDRDRSYYEILTEQIRKDGTEKQVHFLGQVENLPEFRKQCGIGIVASQSEAFGRVTVEGMLSDLVMVGADAGGTSELMKDGENGFLYPLGDAEKLAEILERISRASDAEMEKIRKAALETGKQFICGHCAETLTDLFRSFF